MYLGQGQGTVKYSAVQYTSHCVLHCTVYCSALSALSAVHLTVEYNVECSAAHCAVDSAVYTIMQGGYCQFGTHCLPYFMSSEFFNFLFRFNILSLHPKYFNT